MQPYPPQSLLISRADFYDNGCPSRENQVNANYAATVPVHNGHVRLQCRFTSYSSGRIAREYGLSRFLVFHSLAALQRLPIVRSLTRPSRNARDTARERTKLTAEEAFTGI